MFSGFHLLLEVLRTVDMVCMSVFATHLIVDVLQPPVKRSPSVYGIPLSSYHFLLFLKKFTRFLIDFDSFPTTFYLSQTLSFTVVVVAVDSIICVLV